MPKITYVPKNFRDDSLSVIDMANQIISEYQQHGLDLTLRQLYYQFVARALIPNTERSYNRLGEIINDARLAGYIDWNAIVDRTRYLESPPHWSSPENIIKVCADGYRIDKWADQDYRVEVWIEKEALAGILEATCPQLDVAYFSCRGYVSQSAQWRAAQRFQSYMMGGQRPVVIHLGDHDPSGIDMTRDNDERLVSVFRAHGVVVNRIALNMNQVEELQPPPNPAKLSDTRAKDYVRRFGHESWELDALDPVYLQRIITEAVGNYRDDELWEKAVEREEAQRATLQAMSENYEDIVNFLRETDKLED